MDSGDQGRFTLRVPGEFHAEGKAAARELGVSFNALLLVALREFLDRRRAGAGVAAEAVERSLAGSAASGGAKVAPAPVRVSGGPIEAPAGARGQSRRSAKHKKRKR